MKGFGTDEKTLIKVLCDKDPHQIDAIRTAFEKGLGRKLIKDIESETSSWFEFGLVQLARGPLLADVFNLYGAMSGPGTKERVLNDILLGKSNADMQAIKSTYYKTFRNRLEDDVKGDLSFKTERHFLIVLAANRAEDSAPVIPQQIDDDVMQIYRATEGKTGTDEILVCSIMSQRNDNQLRAIAHTYKQKFNRDLEKVIKSVSCNFPCFISYSNETRNSLAIWKMLYSSNCVTRSTSICMLPNSLKMPWPAWAQRTTCSFLVSSAITGIVTQ